MTDMDQEFQTLRLNFLPRLPGSRWKMKALYWWKLPSQDSLERRREYIYNYGDERQAELLRTHPVRESSTHD